jgi:hypothetical protein
VFRQVQNRITHQLSRAMVGDVAAPVTRVKFHMHLAEDARSGAQMFAFAVAAKGYYMRMLAEEQHVGDFVRFTRFHQRVLQVARRPVRDDPEVHYPGDFLCLLHEATGCNFLIFLAASWIGAKLPRQ